jgi:hypothetical protein
MPKKLHNKLVKSARKRGLTGERRDAYVYGTLGKASKKRASGGVRSRRTTR